jgi:hypothetical protein
MTFLRLRIAMTSPSSPLRRLRNTSPSTIERVGLDEELPTILRTIGWGKLYDEPRQGSRLLTLKFLATFEIVENGRKLLGKFRLFRKSFGCDLSRFSELLNFSKSC